MYKKRACTLLVFTQPTNKYWTDQLRPLRGPEENISEQQEQRRQESRRNGGGKKRGNRWNTGGGKHISTLGAISSPLPPLHPTPRLSIPSLPLSWLCHPSWEWDPQRHAGCRSQRQKTPSSSCSANQSRSKNTLLLVKSSFSLGHLFMRQAWTFSTMIKGDEMT